MGFPGALCDRSPPPSSPARRPPARGRHGSQRRYGSRIGMGKSAVQPVAFFMQSFPPMSLQQQERVPVAEHEVAAATGFVKMFPRVFAVGAQPLATRANDRARTMRMASSL